MSIAAILNKSAGNNGHAEVLVFYPGSNNSLFLTSFPSNAPARTAKYSAESKDVKGQLQKPTDLAAVELGSLVAVYGVLNTTPVGTTESKGQIALVSPVTTSLGIECETTYGRIAVSVDPLYGIARIYYRAPGKTNPTYIYEATVSTLSHVVDNQIVYKHRDIHEKTHLAAFYNSTTKERHVIFQAAEDGPQLLDYNIDTDTSVKLGNCDPKSEAAGLAAIYIPETDNAYCYFVHEDTKKATYVLHKSKHVCKDKSRDEWKWAAATKVMPTALVEQNSHVSVIKKADAGGNYIVFVDATGRIGCRFDPW